MSTPKVDHGAPVRLGFSVAELAAALDTSSYTVRRAIKNGEIAAFPLFGVGELRISVFEVARVIGVAVADLDGLLTQVAARRSA